MYQQRKRIPPKQDKWKHFTGNLILDLTKIASKPLFWELLASSLSIFLLSEFFKGRGSRIHSFKDITESFIFANRNLHILLKSYDPVKGRFRAELYPAGLFSRFMCPKTPPEFELELAYCHRISASGNLFLQKFAQQKSGLTFRIDTFQNQVIRGWLFQGRVYKRNINELMLRKGQCELFAENLEELSEDTLRMIDEMKLNETYAKLTGKGIWEEYYKSSAKVNKLDSWFQYKLKRHIMKNKRWIKRVLA